jgi:hypothetical protein
MPVHPRRAAWLVTVTETQSHYIRFEDGVALESWSCACGAVGVDTADLTGRDEARAHQRD